MFVYPFVDPDMRVEIFFTKEGAAENRGVDLETGDMGNSEHLYWRLTRLLPNAFQKEDLLCI